MRFDPEQLERFMLAALTGLCSNQAYNGIPEHQLAYCALAFAREGVEALKAQLDENEVQS
jgi:hypothetical protein